MNSPFAETAALYLQAFLLPGRQQKMHSGNLKWRQEPRLSWVRWQYC